MGYRLLADLLMLAHFAFLAFLTAGGFLAWRFHWLIVPHVATAIWGVISVATGVECPLTWWEDAARRRAGEAGLSRGFIDTYLTGVVYPTEALGLIQSAVAVSVLVSWAGFALRLRRSRTRRPPAGSGRGGG